jgi:hypothetical protein
VQAKKVLEAAGLRVEEAKTVPTGEPASLRRKIRDAKDTALAEAERIYTGVGQLVKRRDITDAIPAALDSADHTANNVAREYENAVRLTAGESGKTRREQRTTLTSANPMRDSGAVIGRFKMSDLTPAAQAKFQTLFRDYLAKHPGGPPIATRIDALRSATAQLINEGDLRADRLSYTFNDQAKAQLPVFMNQVDTAAAKARSDLKTAGWFERRILTKKLRFLQNLREEIREADRSWNDPTLRSTAIAAQREFDQIFQRGVDFGSKLHYDPDYAPGRYEGEFISEGKILFPGMNMLGGRWKSPKTFKNIYEAVNAGPYMSITRDIASMVGHRARQEERAIARKEWVSNMKNMTDPDSGLPVAADTIKDSNGDPAPPSTDYQVIYPFGWRKGIAVHRAWSGLVKTITGESKVTEFAPTRVLLELEQRLKHTLLVGDFFHLGRLSYYAASIMGRKAGFKGGLSAIDFREADLPRAVKQGLVSKQAADWVTERIPVNFGGRQVMFSRRQIADGFQRHGLNVGQIQDALYKDLTGKTPLVGPYNKWLFDSYTRGLMMESAVKEFERLNKAHPEIESRKLMRDIARDTNRFYGNIGRQGWFKSKTWQDISRMAFLAPQWVEGLVMKEAGTYKRAAYAATGARALGVVGGREGLPAMGTLGRGIGRGMLAMLAITQGINLITRGKPTWMNDEEGHKFDAWIPGGQHGFFLNPLSVFNELSHDLWRYGETKPKAWDAVNQIGSNKLSPFGRLLLVLHDSKSPTGEYQTTTSGVLGKAAEQLTPAPISFGKAAREIGHAVSPGTIAPNPPGAFQRQTMQWAGLKAEPGASASQRVSRMADRFKQANGIGQTGFQFETTDQPSYVKLRTALRNGDEAAATKILQQTGKTPAEAGKAMKLWVNRPWTGSKKGDRAFFATLTDKELETVSQAQLERQAILERFYDLLLSQP